MRFINAIALIPLLQVSHLCVAIHASVALPPVDVCGPPAEVASSQPKYRLVWTPFDSKTWLNKQPSLSLRPMTHFWRDVPTYAPARIRIDHLELPTMSDFVSLWQTLSHYPKDSEHLIIVGDSLSATDHYLRCFKDRLPNQKYKPAHAISLIKQWRSQGASGVLKRDSYATQPGATSWRLTRKKPLRQRRTYGHQRVSLNTVPQALLVPLLREVYESPARFAVVLLGTNDLHYRRGIERFSAHYLQIVETLIDVGVLPILFTIPPKLNRRGVSDPKVSVFNHIIRVIAARERLPLVHFHQALLRLRNYGLRADGIHLNAYQGGCNLERLGLRFGQNLRNHLTLNALTNLKRYLQSMSDHQLRCGPPNLRSVFRSKQQVFESTQAKINTQHLSIVTQTSPVINPQSLCWRHVAPRAKRSLRWRLLRPMRSTAMGPPRTEYGTWRSVQYHFTITQSSRIKWLTLGSLGRKPDLSREQFWIHTVDGRCLKLSGIYQEIRLPRGQNTIVHYARLDDRFQSPPSNQPPEEVISRVVFSWE